MFTPFGEVNLTGLVNDVPVLAGETVMVSQFFEIDLTLRQRYTVMAIIAGNFEENGSCSSFDFLDFFAPNATSPIIPIDGAPTAAPV